MRTRIAPMFGLLVLPSVLMAQDTPPGNIRADWGTSNESSRHCHPARFSDWGTCGSGRGASDTPGLFTGWKAARLVGQLALLRRSAFGLGHGNRHGAIHAVDAGRTIGRSGLGRQWRVRGDEVRGGFRLWSFADAAGKLPKPDAELAPMAVAARQRER